jgi:hypothetical protein
MHLDPSEAGQQSEAAEAADEAHSEFKLQTANNITWQCSFVVASFRHGI